ncbi:MAG: DivIVA domain-containing protein [Candidatus Zixiibacteriota bacterium]
MELSPNDIRNADFPTSMRGYDKQEVKKYLEQVASALEKIKQDNLRLSMEVDSLKTQLAGLRSFEDTIKSAAIDARRNADTTISSAKKEAELMLVTARKEAEQAIGNRANKIREIEQQLESLELTKKSYIGKFRMLLQSHLEIIEEIASSSHLLAPAPSHERDDIQVTDSSEITRKSRETVATQPTNTQKMKVEEANAVGSIVSVKSADHSSPAPAGQPVDPELAAALEQYAHHGGAKPELEKTTYSRTNLFTPSTPTNEDIPYGQISTAPESAEPAENSSGKLEILSASDDSMGSNLISFEQLGTPMQSAPPTQMGPDSLAAELDRVVAKFEEEIAKAEKNA